MISNNPCINCITLPICKSQVLEQLKVFRITQKRGINPKSKYAYTSVMITIYKKCSILRDYLKGDQDYLTTEYSPQRVDEFSKEFTKTLNVSVTLEFAQEFMNTPSYNPK